MIRMTITQEVEATPQQVRDELTKWANRDGAEQFPHAPGEFCRLTPELAEALGVHPEAPVLVVGRAEGCNIGTVAFVTKTGGIAPMAVTPGQIRPAEDELVAEPEPADA